VTPTDRSDTVLDAIWRHAQQRPDHPAIREPGRSLTYKGLWEAAIAVADYLQVHGVEVGDRVALAAGNSVEFVVGAVGTMIAGATFVPLAEADPPARLATVVGDARPVVVLTGNEFDASASQAEAWGIPIVPIGATAEAAVERQAPPHGGRRAPAYIIYTSGTTGTPKGVTIGVEAFARAVRAAARAADVQADNRSLCVSPFHFDGSYSCLWPALSAGGTAVLRRRDALIYPRTFIRAVLDEGITHSSFTPSYLRILLTDRRLSNLAGSTLRVIALGGEQVVPDDIITLRRAVLEVRVVNRYGPTECTIAVSHEELTPELVATGVIPIGRPHPEVGFHLLDDDGLEILGPGRSGELWVSGAQLMDGYWNAPDLTAGVMRRDVIPGVLAYRTGDLAYRDDEGRYVCTGRTDSVVKRRGMRISLAELTAAVRSAPGVTGAAAVPFDDDGQLGIVAFVSGTVDMQSVRSRVRLRVPDTMMPDRFIAVDPLPATGSGKVDDKALLSAHRLAPPGSKPG
jgi:amino acid adenylation domain-containing protein